jgi:glycosyltransferase involved in cell wall biosynthesis
MRRRPEARPATVKLWVFNHYADPPEGFATRSFDIAKRLSAGGIPTTIFTSNFNHYLFRPMRRLGWRPWKTEVVDGVRIVWINTVSYRRNDARRVLNMVSFTVLVALRGLTMRERPDAVIGVSVHPLAPLAALLVARARRARFFVEITDLWPETLIQFGRIRRASVAARSMRALERFLYANAERVIMLWRDTGDYIEGLGIPRQKLLWLPHGVELERYADLQPYTGGDNSPFRVVYLGSFVGGMSLDTILDAALELQRRGRDEIRIDLYGAGTLKEEIIGRASALGLSNVTFPDPVPKARIAEALGHGDAYIYGIQDLPLYRYGMSLNKLMDYLAGGRPIVFFGRSSYDPVEIAHAGITVVPGDPAALADALQEVASMPPEERRAMGRRGREYLEAHHTIPVLVERLRSVLVGAD